MRKTHKTVLGRIGRKLMKLLKDIFKMRRSPDWIARLEEQGVPASPT
jgi:hypothetical protein